MKPLLFLGLLAATFVAHGDGLPIITAQSTNQTVLPGSTATFSVTASGATAFQWRHNGTVIPGATNATVQITNVQAGDTGYYLALAGNDAGWMPSQMVYLLAGYPAANPSVAHIPFSNFGSSNAPARNSCDISFAIITNGSAQIIAGPELDQMQPVGFSTSMFNGVFDDDDQRITNVLAGQAVYYRVVITHACYASGPIAQTSTIIKLTASGSSDPVAGLKFPLWPEWPEPNATNDSYFHIRPPASVTLPPGGITKLTNEFFGFTDFGIPKCQWRKDGKLIPGATNLVQVFGGSPGGYYQAILSITNLQATDAGVYDLMILGNYWGITPKTIVSTELSGSTSVLLQAPRFDGTNFISTIMGSAGSQYTLQWSSNLVDWNSFATLTNTTGTITFTNPTSAKIRFYRYLLLP